MGTVERVEKYISERKKSRGIDLEHIHGLNCGDDEREAVLLLSDVETMLDIIKNHLDSGGGGW